MTVVFRLAASARMDSDARQELCDWLSAHQVNPTRVKACAVIDTAEGPVLHVAEYVCGKNGVAVIDVATLRPVCASRSLPVVVEVPESVLRAYSGELVLTDADAVVYVASLRARDR